MLLPVKQLFHASSSVGNSSKLLEEMTKNGNWKSEHKISSSTTNSDIKLFNDSIK